MAGASIVQGIVKGKEADKQRQAYDAKEASIPLEDPREVQHREELRLRRQHLERGTDTTTASRLADLRNRETSVLNAQLRAGMGSNEMLRTLAAGNAGAAGIAGASAAGVNNILSQEGAFTSHLADRVYNRQLSQANMLWSEYARKKEDSNRAINAGLALIPDISAGGFMKSNPVDNASSATPRIASAGMTNNPFAVRDRLATNYEYMPKKYGYYL